MEYVIPGFIYGLVVCVMLSIGIIQFRSKKPVSFYTGEAPPAEHELRDLRAWNRCHGIMWIIYGLIIALSALGGFLLKSDIAMILLTLGGPIIPVPFMVMYHNRLLKKYKLTQTHNEE